MIPAPDSSDADSLLQKVLQPLLDDFQYWFHRSLDLLESEPLPWLEPTEQDQLTQRLHNALAETRTAAALLKATNGQVGVDTAQVMAWHQLVAEAWAVARRHRSQPGEKT